MRSDDRGRKGSQKPPCLRTKQKNVNQPRSKIGKSGKAGKNCEILLESIFGVQRATGLAFESEINYPSSHCTATMSYVQVELK